MTLIADRPLLTSPRLVLRAPRKEDAGAIAALANDWEVARRLTRLPHPYTLEDAVFFLEEIVPKELVWIIESPAELLGVAGLTPDPEHDPEKWEPVFGKRSCSNKELERGDDSKKHHPAPDTGALELGTGSAVPSGDTASRRKRPAS